MATQGHPMRKDWEDITFKEIKVNGEPLEYCVDYVESTGWALALATYWSGEFKGQPVPAPGTVLGYETVECRGKIEALPEKEKVEMEANWQEWSGWSKVNTTIPIEVSIAVNTALQIQWSDDGINPETHRDEYYSAEPVQRQFPIPTGGVYMRYRVSFCG